MLGKSLEKRQIYKFGPFCLDATAKVLSRDGEPLHLARKAVETLLVLVENSGQVLTKDEIIRAVWQDRVVDEANLTQNVAVVRRAMGVERGEPGYIETFAGRGYRVVGPVDSGNDAPVPLPEVVEPVKPKPRYWIGAVVLGILVLAGTAFWLTRRGVVQQENFQIRPLTRMAGKEFQPALSPDGTQVAFVWEQEGTKPAQIWLQAPGAGSPRLLTATPGQYSSPAWSPDGKFLACLRFQNESGEIVIVPLDGGAERVLGRVFPTRFGLPNRHLDWSPDGKTLAIDDATSPNQPFGIYLTSVADGTRKRLTQPDDFIVGDLDPRFSPDGKTISFIRAFHRAWQELYTIPFEGGNPRQITKDDKQVSGQDWLPDGSALVFASNRAGEFRLWKSSGLSQHSTGIYGDFPIQFSLARKAPALAYSVLQQDFNIWRLDLAAKGNMLDRWTRVVSSSAQDASPQYSADGGRICFRSDRSGEENLWVCDADGSNAVRVTSDEKPSVGRWSPDGKSIVFNGSRSREIYVGSTGSDGKWSVRKTGAIGIHPVFSSDGASIFAAADDAIVRLPVNGGAPTDVWKGKGLSLGMSVDGKSIYFVREVTDTSLWQIDLATGAASKLLDGLVPYCTSCWAAAPNGIYYLGVDRGTRKKQTVYFHDFATMQDKPIVEYPEPLLPIGSGPFSLSKDGRYLLCVRVDPSNTDVMQVEPFR